MTPNFDYILAIALITSPFDVNKNYDQYKYLGPMLKDVSVKLELTGKDEQWWFRTNPFILQNEWIANSFKEDLSNITVLYQELKDVPKASFANVFQITDKEIDSMMEFNRQYMGALEINKAKYFFNARPEYQWYEDAQKETTIIYRIYEGVKYAKLPHMSVSWKRRYLKKVREDLGDEMFFKGELPPPVPTWRFQEKE